MEAQIAEKELTEQITKATAELAKVTNVKEESLRNLAVHRNRVREDQKRLDEEKMVRKKRREREREKRKKRREKEKVRERERETERRRKTERDTEREYQKIVLFLTFLN